MAGSKTTRATAARKQAGSRRKRTQRATGLARVITQRQMTRPRSEKVLSTADSMRVHGEELGFVVTKQVDANTLNLANAVSIWPGFSGMPRLDAYAALYDMYRINRCVVKYRTSTGTTVNGAILMGVDYDLNDLPTTLPELQATTPRVRVPVWENASITLPIDRLNRKKWMMCKSGGGDVENAENAAATVLASAPTTSDDFGEVWVDYDITFAGPIAGVKQSPTPPPPPKGFIPTTRVWRLNTSIYNGTGDTYDPLFSTPYPQQPYDAAQFNFSPSAGNPQDYGTNFTLNNMNVVVPAKSNWRVSICGSNYLSASFQPDPEPPSLLQDADIEEFLDDLPEGLTGSLISKPYPSTGNGTSGRTVDNTTGQYMQTDYTWSTAFELYNDTDAPIQCPQFTSFLSKQVDYCTHYGNTANPNTLVRVNAGSGNLPFTLPIFHITVCPLDENDYLQRRNPRYNDHHVRVCATLDQILTRPSAFKKLLASLDEIDDRQQANTANSKA